MFRHQEVRKEFVYMRGRSYKNRVRIYHEVIQTFQISRLTSVSLATTPTNATTTRVTVSSSAVLPTYGGVEPKLSLRVSRWPIAHSLEIDVVHQSRGWGGEFLREVSVVLHAKFNPCDVPVARIVPTV